MAVNNPYRSSESALPSLCASAQGRTPRSGWITCSMRNMLVVLLVCMAIISYAFHVYHLSHASSIDINIPALKETGSGGSRLRGDHFNRFRRPTMAPTRAVVANNDRDIDSTTDNMNKLNNVKEDSADKEIKLSTADHQPPASEPLIAPTVTTSITSTNSISEPVQSSLHITKSTESPIQAVESSIQVAEQEETRDLPLPQQDRIPSTSTPTSTDNSNTSNTNNNSNSDSGNDSTAKHASTIVLHLHTNNVSSTGTSKEEDAKTNNASKSITDHEVEDANTKSDVRASSTGSTNPSTTTQTTVSNTALPEVPPVESNNLSKDVTSPVASSDTSSSTSTSSSMITSSTEATSTTSAPPINHNVPPTSGSNTVEIKDVVNDNASTSTSIVVNHNVLPITSTTSVSGHDAEQIPINHNIPPSTVSTDNTSSASTISSDITSSASHSENNIDTSSVTGDTNTITASTTSTTLHVNHNTPPVVDTASSSSSATTINHNIPPVLDTTGTITTNSASTTSPVVNVLIDHNQIPSGVITSTTTSTMSSNINDKHTPVVSITDSTTTASSATGNAVVSINHNVPPGVDAVNSDSTSTPIIPTITNNNHGPNNQENNKVTSATSSTGIINSQPLHAHTSTTINAGTTAVIDVSAALQEASHDIRDVSIAFDPAVSSSVHAATSVNHPSKVDQQISPIVHAKTQPPLPHQQPITTPVSTGVGDIGSTGVSGMGEIVSESKSERTAFDLPKSNSKPITSTTTSAATSNTVDNNATVDGIYDFCVEMMKDNASKPVIDTYNIPIDQFQPTSTGTTKQQQRAWQSAVLNMKARIQRMDVGGSKLREILSDEVNKLKETRKSIFCV
jgi:trimeric autotransporter adhesin